MDALRKVIYLFLKAPYNIGDGKQVPQRTGSVQMNGYHMQCRQKPAESRKEESYGTA